ncbi:MAG: periplasmic heavy metal sensor [Thiotrichaceae bacterium]|nr:periplasmic heavy metal sensor [Thiotrichaceae bacterium]
MSARNLWLVLGSSFALNLLLLGIFLGGYLRPSAFPPQFPPPPYERGGHGDDHRRPPPPHAPPLMRMLQSLPEAAQEKVRPLLDKYEPELKLKADVLHELRHEIRELLQAESLDMQKVNASLAESQRAMANFQTSLHRALGEIAVILTAGERKILAESLSKRP